MFEKFNHLAEAAATNVSRRQFLGRFGSGATAVAAATAGLLALPSLANAGRGGHICSADFGVETCRGKKVGSPCEGANGPGHCKAQPGFQFPDGTYNCWTCGKAKGNGNGDKA